MTQVLFISVFRDNTGWGHAALDYLLALDYVGVDVAARSLRLNQNKDYSGIPQRFFELEAKECHQPDVVIQMVLPHQMTYTGLISKNIGLFCSETDHFRDSNWPTNLNLMDEVWVFNKQSKQATIDSGVTVPIHVVPCPVDVNKFNRGYPVLDIRNYYQDSFIFYTVGEFTRRKNLHALIKAFHLEFAPEEQVELLLKTNGSPEQVKSLCRDIKENLKLYPKEEHYKQELIITDRISEDAMMSLHNTCDCFVSASYGEALCLPLRDAMGMARAVIGPNYGGFKDYLDESCGWTVGGRLEPVFGATETFFDIFSGREKWYSVDILDLQRAMREAYENWPLREKKAIEGMKRVQEFSYEKIGNLMKELIK